MIQFNGMHTLSDNQQSNCITVDKRHHFEIPQNYLVENKNSLFSNNDIDETTQIFKTKYQNMYSDHYLADEAHNILNQLSSNKSIEKVSLLLHII